MDFLYAYCAAVINRIWDLETANPVRSFAERSLRKSKYSRLRVAGDT